MAISALCNWIVKQYPNKPLEDALIDKLKDGDNDNDDKIFTVWL